MNSTLFSVIAFIVSMVVFFVSIFVVEDVRKMEGNYVDGSKFEDRIKKLESDYCSYHFFSAIRDQTFKNRQKIEALENNVEHIDHVQSNIIRGLVEPTPHPSCCGSKEDLGVLIPEVGVRKVGAYQPIILSQNQKHMWVDDSLYKDEELAWQKARFDIGAIKRSISLGELKRYDF